ncbi:Na(+)-translocating NADH-quinone reductase subunit A [Flavobacteriaceae bacterium]|nr:Na(+)-translocating NADH-quinone reductase subunit A [Flavobacteriaceae bacterium]
MSNDIHFKKGLDINLIGEAKKVLEPAPKSKFYSVEPSDFHGINPKLNVKISDNILAGDILFYDKSDELLKFASPVSGQITEIIRGEKRKILSIKILADENQVFKNSGCLKKSANKEEIIEFLLSVGCWPFIMQRPYAIIANYKSSPKSIFVSGYSSEPLSADLDFTLKDNKKEIQAAVSILNKLTEGKVNVSIEKSSDSIFREINDIELYNVSGPHPSGNVGSLINKVDPVNKGESVWTISAQDLVIIGNMILTGEFKAERIVSLSGSSIESPRYLKTTIGCQIDSITNNNIHNLNDNNRIISGTILSGKKVEPDGHLDYYSNSVTVIPEGDDYELFGWTKPVFNKVSVSRALTFSWLFPKKKYDLTTNTNGEHRAFVTTGTYEKVFPLDIFPMHILKACMYNDLDEMEALGMYEVAPEDFALTEFVCVSKQPHQKIIREGLDLMKKEIG